MHCELSVHVLTSSDRGQELCQVFCWLSVWLRFEVAAGFGSGRGSRLMLLYTPSVIEVDALSGPLGI